VHGSPPHRIGRPDREVSAALPVAKVHEMGFLALFALLALFSIISIVVSSEDPKHPSDPRDNPLFWATFGRR
jgi:hypothetical protein